MVAVEYTSNHQYAKAVAKEMACCYTYCPIIPGRFYKAPGYRKPLSPHDRPFCLSRRWGVYSGEEMFRLLANVALDDFNTAFGLNPAQFLVAKPAYDHLNEGGKVILKSSVASEIGIPSHAVMPYMPATSTLSAGINRDSWVPIR